MLEMTADNDRSISRIKIKKSEQTILLVRGGQERCDDFILADRFIREEVYPVHIYQSLQVDISGSLELPGWRVLPSCRYLKSL